MKVPILNLERLHDSIKNEIYGAFNEVFNEQHFILGKQVKDLEERISSYIGTEYAVGVASGTDALLLALKALSYKIYGREYFKPEDEIITTPFTFVATADTILLSGATPVFVDIDPYTYNINPENIRKYLTNNSSKVKAIIPVHLYGQACKMDEIMKIAREFRVYIIEDVAQAFGGKWKDKKLGSFGIAGCLSFFPTKSLGSFGDGGMVVTNDKTIAEIVDMLRKHGGKDKYNVNILGHNSRLDTLQASILLQKLKHVDRWNENKRKIAEVYNAQLSGINDLILPITHNPLPITPVYHQYTIRTKKRDKLQSYLKEKEIQTMVYYPISLHKQKLFEERTKIFGSLKNTKLAAKEVLSLPIDPLQTEEETTYVVNMVKEF